MKPSPRSNNQEAHHCRCLASRIAAWRQRLQRIPVVGQMFFFLIGFLALAWFLIRVIPKPQRATYPCQRVAMPLASSFVLWLLGLAVSAKLFRAAIVRMTCQRVSIIGILLVFVASMVFVVAQGLMPGSDTFAAPPHASGNPLGTGRGVYPGRVVWVHDPDATDWAGPGSGERQYTTNCTDAALVGQMFTHSIHKLAGEVNTATAWEALFTKLNEKLGRTSQGYQPGETIAIKINFTTCYGDLTPSTVDETTWEKKSPGSWAGDDWLDRTDPSPALTLALLDHLVNIVGVDQTDITIGDPTTFMPAYFYDRLHDRFPNLVYLDYLGGPDDYDGGIADDRTPVSFGSVPFGWSTADYTNQTPDFLPTYFGEADYLINFALLKSHDLGGVTLCAKNHYGSLYRKPIETGYLNLHNYLPGDNGSATLVGARPGTGHYRALVDLMGHRDLGGKTVLYLIDGLFGGEEWFSMPSRWNMPPFNNDWPSSLFVSQDPVAIDSVGYDFVLQQWPALAADPNMEGGATDFLIEAALADNPPSGTFYDPEGDGTNMVSLGVHEHWNNVVDKQYSRNLGAAEGIELVGINGKGEPLKAASLYIDAESGGIDLWSIDATPTEQYQLLYSSSLIDPLWQTIEVFRLDSSSTNWMMNTSADDRGFYQLIRIPPMEMKPVSTPPVIDGNPSDSCWTAAEWQAIDQTWLPYGDTVPATDFSGRYKTAWSESENVIYFLAEIIDDVFVDGYVYANGGWSDYDVVEVFIDEDKSGGLHTFDATGSAATTWGTNSANAFSYHLMVSEPADGATTTSLVAACDLAGPANSWTPVNYANHLPEFALKKIGTTYYWEFSLAVYDDTYQDANPEASRVQLTSGKVMGLSMAYCDNDDPDEDPKTRDNFFGSVPVTEAAQNEHWKQADGFGSATLLPVDP